MPVNILYCEGGRKSFDIRVVSKATLQKMFGLGCRNGQNCNNLFTNQLFENS